MEFALMTAPGGIPHDAEDEAPSSRAKAGDGAAPITSDTPKTTNHPTPGHMNETLHHIFLGMVTLGATLIAFIQATFGPPMLADVPASETARQIAHNVDMLRDTYLFTVVILGSLAGAAMSYMLYPLPGPKGMVFKFLVSGFSGIVFSPITATVLAPWFGMEMTGMWAIAVAAFVSFTSWSLLQIVEPAAKRIASWWVRTKLGQLDEPEYRRARSTKADARENDKQDT